MVTLFSFQIKIKISLVIIAKLLAFVLISLKTMNFFLGKYVLSLSMVNGKT